MVAAQRQYDLFIAHAQPDIALAESVYDLFAPEFETFLASRTLAIGDHWPVETPRALRNSKMSVILVTDRSVDTYYQQEEIVEAIGLTRQPNEQHRVAPVLVGAVPDPPYGLRMLQSLSIDGPANVAEIYERLAPTIRKIRLSEAGEYSGSKTSIRFYRAQRLMLDTAAPYISVGRGAHQTLQLEHRTVSREHADVTQIGERLILRHLSSKNPTTVRSQHETRTLYGHDAGETIELFEGSTIKFGDYPEITLEYFLDESGVQYAATTEYAGE